MQNGAAQPRPSLCSTVGSRCAIRPLAKCETTKRAAQTTRDGSDLSPVIRKILRQTATLTATTTEFRSCGPVAEAAHCSSLLRSTAKQMTNVKGSRFLHSVTKVLICGAIQKRFQTAERMLTEAGVDIQGPKNLAHIQERTLSLCDKTVETRRLEWQKDEAGPRLCLSAVDQEELSLSQCEARA